MCSPNGQNESILEKVVHRLCQSNRLTNTTNRKSESEELWNNTNKNQTRFQILDHAAEYLYKSVGAPVVGKLVLKSYTTSTDSTAGQLRRMNCYWDGLLLSIITPSELSSFGGIAAKPNVKIKVGQKSYKLVQNSYKLVRQLVTNVPVLVVIFGITRIPDRIILLVS